MWDVKRTMMLALPHATCDTRAAKNAITA